MKKNLGMAFTLLGLGVSLVGSVLNQKQMELAVQEEVEKQLNKDSDEDVTE